MITPGTVVDEILAKTKTIICWPVRDDRSTVSLCRYFYGEFKTSQFDGRRALLWMRLLGCGLRVYRVEEISD